MRSVLIGCLIVPTIVGCAALSGSRTSVEQVIRHARASQVRSPDAIPMFALPLPRMKVLSPFGNRGGKPHMGLDLDGKYGDDVRAACRGTVIYAGDGIAGYGFTVILQHEGEYTSLYAHNSEILADVGASVESGDVIARIGDSGNASGPHLHFEIRRGVTPLDPRRLLNRRKPQ